MLSLVGARWYNILMFCLAGMGTVAVLSLVNGARWYNTLMFCLAGMAALGCLSIISDVSEEPSSSDSSSDSSSGLYSSQLS